MKRPRWWIAPLFSLCTILLGGGVVWGALQTTVSANEKAALSNRADISALRDRELEQTQQLGQIQGQLDSVQKTLDRIEQRLP